MLSGYRLISSREGGPACQAVCCVVRPACPPGRRSLAACACRRLVALQSQLAKMQVRRVRRAAGDCVALLASPAGSARCLMAMATASVQAIATQSRGCRLAPPAALPNRGRRLAGSSPASWDVNTNTSNRLLATFRCYALLPFRGARLQGTCPGLCTPCPQADPDHTLAEVLPLQQQLDEIDAERWVPCTCKSRLRQLCLTVRAAGRARQQ